MTLRLYHGWTDLITTPGRPAAAAQPKAAAEHPPDLLNNRPEVTAVLERLECLALRRHVLVRVVREYPLMAERPAVDAFVELQTGNDEGQGETKSRQRRRAGRDEEQGGCDSATKGSWGS